MRAKVHCSFPYIVTGVPELEEENVTSTNIDYEVDNTQPTERRRREVRAFKYLDEYERLLYPVKQKRD